LLKAVMERYKVSETIAREIAREVGHYLEARGLSRFHDELSRIFGREYASNLAVEFHHRSTYEKLYEVKRK